MKIRLELPFALVILLSLCSCKKEVSKTGSGIMHVEAGIEIKYINTAGNNLLLANTPNNYKIDKMRLYFIENQVKRPFSLPFPNEDIKGIKQVGTANDPSLAIAVNIGYKGDIIKQTKEETISHLISILEADGTDNTGKLQDTIKTELHERTNHIWVEKVWYNNILVYDLSGKIGGPRVGQFIIKK